MNRVFSLLFCLFLPLLSSAYWQQYTHTAIDVRLDDEQHVLNAYEKISYTNNSPDTLRYIYIHLWPNAYKNDRTAFCEQQVVNGSKDFYFAKEEDRGYIDSLRFSIDGVEVLYEPWRGHEDVAYIRLPQLLLPGQTIQIETPFRVKIPKVFSRLGHEGQAYFISQWYPKPAVYDTYGWHPMPYLDQGEFYSEYGSFDVNISLPRNYVLMATGNCESPEELQFMDSLSRLALPADTLYKHSFPPSDVAYKTIRYTEANVHDFAWFADKRWVLRMDTVQGAFADTQVKCMLAFLPPHQKEWLKGMDYLKTTLQYYGTTVGAYPYRTLKAVEGDMSAGGGMEYPTITVIDKTSVDALDEVLVHEAGHNWFYGILGTNERMYPWMDEGINSFYEAKTLTELHKDASRLGAVERFLLLSLAIHRDQNVSLAADEYTEWNYDADVYKKTARLLWWLETEMGQDSFQHAMHDYYHQWRFRHPYPQDLFDVFQKHATQNLDWLFKGAMQSERPINFSLRSAKRRREVLRLLVRNKSDFPAPLHIRVKQEDGSEKLFAIAPFYKDTTIRIPMETKWKKVYLESSPMEQQLSDNVLYKRFLNRHAAWKLKPITSWNRTANRQIYFSLAPAYNFYDKLGLGLLLHNVSLNPQAFQFALLPIYSSGSKQLNGLAAFAYTGYPKRNIQSWTTQLNLKSFSNEKAGLNIPQALYARYLKVAPSFELVFKEASVKATRKHSLLLKTYWIREEFFRYYQSAVDSLYRPYKQDTVLTYAKLQYSYADNKAFHPYSYRLQAELGQQYAKLALEANARIDYDVANKSLYIRCFAGKLFHFASNSLNNYRYWWNSTSTGQNDYLYDNVFFGRSENTGILSRQLMLNEGGFKQATTLLANPIGRSDNWILALNLKTDLPFGKLPLRWYADIATFSDAKQQNQGGNIFLFSSGLELSLFNEFLRIYAPVFNSKDFSDYNRSMFPDNTFLHTISFSFNLGNFNALKAPSFVFDKFVQNL